MGVTGFNSLIKNSIKRSLRYYKGQTVGIDVSIYLYKFKYASTTESMLTKFAAQVNTFKKNDIIPIYIFDGKSSYLKQDTKDARKEKSVITITKEDRKLLKSYLDESDIEWHTAPTEAEKYCAYLNKINYISAIFSNDRDSLVFGGKVLVTYAKSEYHEIKLEDILSDNNITPEQLIDVSIASGCDFDSKGIPNIGIKKGLTLIKKFGDIKNWEGVEIPETLDIDSIRDIFLNFDQEEELFAQKSNLEDQEVKPEDQEVKPEDPEVEALCEDLEKTVV